MFRRIWTNGGSSLVGDVMRSENIRPNTGIGRYVEIAVGDMVAVPGAKAVTRYHFSDLCVQGNRPTVGGRAYMIVFHPALSRAPLVLDGLAVGTDVFDGVASITEGQSTHSWIARVYELDTHVGA